MEAQNLAKHQDAAAGLVADEDNLVQAALHLHFAFGHAGRLDQVAGERREAGEREFVDLGRNIGRAHVHLRGELLGDDVDDELARGLDVLKVSL